MRQLICHTLRVVEERKDIRRDRWLVTRDHLNMMRAKSLGPAHFSFTRRVITRFPVATKQASAASTAPFKVNGLVLHLRFSAMDRYDLGESIGEGSFGDVFLAVKKSTGEKRAIKRIRGNYSWNDTATMRELQSIVRVKLHAHIVTLFEVIRTATGQAYFVFEYMNLGTLNDLITKTRKGQTKQTHMPQHDIAQISRHILLGLQHLHQSRFMHRDIKPENILLSLGPENTMIAKVSDFSLARGLHEDAVAALTSYVSTRWYRAPELLTSVAWGTVANHTNADRGDGAAPRPVISYSIAIDMFALGCIVAEMFTLLPLFPGRSEADQWHRIVQVLGVPPRFGKPTISAQKKSSPVVVAANPKNGTYDEHRVRANLKQRVPTADQVGQDFLFGILHVDASKRLTASQALKMPFAMLGHHVGGGLQKEDDIPDTCCPRDPKQAALESRNSCLNSETSDSPTSSSSSGSSTTFSSSTSATTPATKINPHKTVMVSVSPAQFRTDSTNLVPRSSIANSMPKRKDISSPVVVNPYLSKRKLSRLR